MRMGATLGFANPLAEDQSMDKMQEKWNENGAKGEASYLVRTALQMVSRIGRNRHSKIAHQKPQMSLSNGKSEK